MAEMRVKPNFYEMDEEEVDEVLNKVNRHILREDTGDKNEGEELEGEWIDKSNRWRFVPDDFENRWELDGRYVAICVDITEENLREFEDNILFKESNEWTKAGEEEKNNNLKHIAYYNEDTELKATEIIRTEKFGRRIRIDIEEVDREKAISEIL
jgi:hypothetical protein